MSKTQLQPIALGKLPPSPRVSIAITCFNYGRFLGECLDSCLSQTVAVDEIVVIDDGSTDNSWQVATAYATRFPSVRAIHGENTGMCGATNAAIAACSGDIILMLDADDVMLPKRVEKVLASFKSPVAGGLPGWVHHPMTRFSTAQPDLGTLPHYADDAHPHGFLADRVREVAPCPVVTPASGLAFRRDLLCAIGALDDPPEMAQDLQLSLAGCLFSPVAYISEPLTRYRIHENSDSAGGLLASLQMVRRVRFRYERLDVWVAGLLQAHRPHAALPWVPLQEQPSYQWLAFLDRWWSGSGRDFGLLSMILRHPQTRAAPLQQRLYFYGAIFLPKAWFLGFSKMLFGSSPLKAYVRRRLGRA